MPRSSAAYRALARANAAPITSRGATQISIKRTRLWETPWAAQVSTAVSEESQRGDSQSQRAGARSHGRRTASRLRRAGRSGHACRLGDGTRAGGSRGKSLPSAGCATKSRARETTGGRWEDVVSRRSARSQSASDSGLRCRARNRPRSGLDGGRPAANATMSVSNRPRVVQAGEQDSRQADLFDLPTRDHRRKRKDAVVLELYSERGK